MVQNDMLLKWYVVGHTHSMIVRCEFGKDISFGENERREIEQIAPVMLFSGEEIRLSNGTFLTMVPRGYVNNYNMTVCPARYAVYCCSFEAAEDVCTIYMPNDACLYQCDVVSRIEVHIIREEMKKKGLFHSKKPEVQYYTIHIPSFPGYEDGSLYYSYDGCRYRYPITRAMLGTSFSVPEYNGSAPFIRSTSTNGFNIVNK